MLRNGFYLAKPTSISYGGTSATITTNGSVEITSCTTISLNGVFSASATNYRVLIRTTPGQDINGLFRYRASGSDNATVSSYQTQAVVCNNTVVTGTLTTDSLAIPLGFPGSHAALAIMDVFRPYEAVETMATTLTTDNRNTIQIFDTSISHNQASAYDGFTLYTTGSAFSGLISVYGMVS